MASSRPHLSDTSPAISSGAEAGSPSFGAPTPLDPRPGEGRRAGRGHITSYGPGRTCQVGGCGTLLSIYNNGHWCALHAHGAETTGA